MSMLNAMDYAARMHNGQKRKNGDDYITHPISVANRLAEAGEDEKTQIVGLFHDLLEDTKARDEDIAEYGDDVLRSVILLSKNRAENKKAYIDNILSDKMAKAVKNADRIDNLTDCAACDDLIFKVRYLSNTEEYYKGKFSKELDNLIDSVKKDIMQQAEDIKKENIRAEYNAYHSRYILYEDGHIYIETKYGYFKRYEDLDSFYLDFDECEIEKLNK